MSEPWRLLYGTTNSGGQGAVCHQCPGAECTQISANCRQLRLNNGGRCACSRTPCDHPALPS